MEPDEVEVWVAAVAETPFGCPECVAPRVGMHVRPCLEDVDGDGRLDVFFANYGANGLFLQRQPDRFADASAAWGIAMDARWDACAFAD